MANPNRTGAKKKQSTTQHKRRTATQSKAPAKKPAASKSRSYARKANTESINDNRVKRKPQGRSAAKESVSRAYSAYKNGSASTGSAKKSSTHTYPSGRVSHIDSRGPVLSSEQEERYRERYHGLSNRQEEREERMNRRGTAEDYVEDSARRNIAANEAEERNMQASRRKRRRVGEK